MTNRLEMSWKIDGFVSEQRYYCSETPINLFALPAPKAVFTGDIRTFVDTNVVAGKTYYVRMSSVKNGIEKISNEVRVELVTYINKFNLPLVSNVVDTVNSGWGSTVSNISFSNGAVFNGASSSITMQQENNFTRLPESSDFDLSVSFNIAAFTNSIMPILYKMTSTGIVEYQIWIEQNRVGFIWYTTSGYKVSAFAQGPQIPVLSATDYKLEFKRRGSNLGIYLNESLKGTWAVQSGIPKVDAAQRLEIGYYSPISARKFHGKIWGINLRVYG